MEALLAVHEAAASLRVSRSTIWRWCRDGTLSSAFEIGRNWLVHRREVKEIRGEQGLSNAEDANIKQELL